MKNNLLIFLLLLASTLSFSQKKEKIKGSKIITHTIKRVESFENIEIEDNIEIYLVKADSASIEIEADDNLHDVLDFKVTGNTLRIITLQNVISSKKFSIRINYSNELNLITVKNEAKLHALNELQLDNVTVKNYDKSKSFLNVNSNNFTLILNDKSYAEINVKATKTTLELSKDADLKALIASPELKLDMYESSDATIEGDAAIAKIRLDNSCDLVAEKLTVETLELAVDNNAKCKVKVSKSLDLDAAGRSEVSVFGEPKITLKRFTNTTTLYKKE